MNKPIVIFRHVATEGPGYLAEFLDRHGLAHHTVRIDAHDPIPESIADAAGLVFMGGPMSVNDPLPWIPKVLKLIREADAIGIPVLGHCLGGQLLAKALGARVRRHRLKEIGWLKVSTVDSPLAHDWLNGLPPQFEVFHWHGETFEIPAGGVHLLRSRHCRNQAYAKGKHLGLQCHVEMTPELVRTWARDGAREIAAAGPSDTVQHRARMVSSLARRTTDLHRVADVLYTRWIQGLKR